MEIDAYLNCIEYNGPFEPTTKTLRQPHRAYVLSNNRLIETTRGGCDERVVASEEEYRTLLYDHFGIELGQKERVERLMRPSLPST
jgi:arylamine N-acetyltransferase